MSKSLYPGELIPGELIKGMKNRFAFLCALISTLFTTVVRAVPGDERWDDQFFTPGVSASSESILSMAFLNDGSILCGGHFGTLGNTTGLHLAKWNGVKWANFGGGVDKPGQPPKVYAIAVDANYIYIGGLFTSAGGVAVTNLARWNGTTWESVGGGVSGGSVREIIVTNGLVTVTGAFTNAGGVSANYIARWDGTNWSNFDGGLNVGNARGFPVESDRNGADFAVPGLALLIRNDELFVGGNFTNAGGILATNIAKWNGSTWQPLGTGSENGVNAPVWELANSLENDLLVAGDFSKAGSSNIDLIVRWNGSTWSPLGQGLFRGSLGRVNALAVVGTNVYAGGVFLNSGTNLISGFAIWNGTQWSKSSAPVKEKVVSIATDGTNIYVSGRLTRVHAPNRNGLVKFDGNTWSVIGNGIATTTTAPQVAAIAVSESGVQVGGRFTGQSTQPQAAAEWDGTNWLRLDGLGPENGAYVLALLNADGKTYAAGSFCCADGIKANRVAVRAGTNWSIMGNGLPATGRALAARGTEVFAGHDGGIARWDGTNWATIGSGLNGSVLAIVCVGNELYAGGGFTQSGTPGITNIARWDGTNWLSLGNGVDGPVYALAAYGTSLYVGGKFTNASGIAANRIARWDGTNWFALGSGFFEGIPGGGNTNTSDIYAAVYALEIATDGTVFAGGNFTKSETFGVNFVAKWNGSTWAPLGSGANSLIFALGIKDRNLFVGGEFFRVANNPSYRFGRWNLEEQLVQIDSLAPSRINFGSNLTYTIKVKNLGDDPSQNSILRAKLPRDSTFVSATLGGIVAGDSLTWNLGSLNTNAEAVVSFSINVNQWSGFVELADYSLTNNSGKEFRGKPVYSTIVNQNFRFLSAGPSQNENIALRIEGLAGMNLVLQSSTNLTNWLNLSTNVLSSHALDLIITNQQNVADFFRLRLIP